MRLSKVHVPNTKLCAAKLMTSQLTLLKEEVSRETIQISCTASNFKDRQNWNSVKGTTSSVISLYFSSIIVRKELFSYKLLLSMTPTFYVEVFSVKGLRFSGTSHTRITLLFKGELYLHDIFFWLFRVFVLSYSFWDNKNTSIIKRTGNCMFSVVKKIESWKARKYFHGCFV